MKSIDRLMSAKEFPTTVLQKPYQKDGQIVILGAGPAGMAAAFRLHGSNRGFSIIEKDSNVGGLAKTITHGPFMLDVGPHILCTKPYVYDFNERMSSFIEELMGDELLHYESLNQKYLETVRVGAAEFCYPIQILNALKNVGSNRALKMIFDYIHAKSHKRPDAHKEISFEKAMISNLGASLAELFILKYSKKTWGFECSSLSSDMAWRVGEFSLLNILKEQFLNFEKRHVAQSGHPVCYPVYGIGTICDRMRDKITEADVGEIRTSSIPTKICHDKGRIVEITVSDQESIRTYAPTHVLSSIPISQLVHLLEPKPPIEVIVAVEGLKYRSHLCLYMLTNKERVLREHCVYFPDLDIPFARMMEQKNYSKETCPDGMTAIAVEFFCWNEDEVWKMDDSQLFKLAIPSLERMGVIKQDEVVEYFTHRERYAYPVYDLGYSERLNVVVDYLSRFRNLRLIGRGGTFTYMGQYRAMEDGINAADSVIEELARGRPIRREDS